MANEDLELEDDFDEEPEEEPEAPVVTAPTPVKRRRRRQVSTGVGAAAPTRADGEASFNYNEAELLINEVFDRIAKKGKSPYDMAIRVSRLMPERQQIGSAFPAELLVGDDTKTPGDKLIDYVTDNYHLPITPGPMKYDIAFVWKVGAQIYTRGTLSLPAAAEILAMRAAQRRNASAAYTPPPNYATAAGFAGTPQYTQPTHYAVPQHYAPPAQQTQDTSSIVAELSYLRGALNEALTAAREGRQPNIQPPPPPVGVAAPPKDSESDTVAKVVAVLSAMGLIQKPNAVGVAAPPPQPPPAMAAEAVSSVTSFKTMVDQVRSLRGLGAELNHIFGDDEDGTPEAAIAPVQPIVQEKPDDGLPFVVTEVPAKWPDGSPVQMARNKESKDIDWVGAGFSNPYVVGKLMDGASKLMEAAANAAAKFSGMQGNVGVGEAKEMSTPAAAPQLTNGSNGSIEKPSI
jgi:hypothetical protein